jgi:hypothetical protein
MEASVISCCKAIQDTTIGTQVDNDHLLGFSRAKFECETTVTSATFCDMLQMRLSPAICSKKRGSLSEGILLLNSNARPHNAAHTLETLRKLMREIMEHPAHSLGLAPSDFHLFGLLKEALGARRFQCDEDVKNTVHQWLCAQPKTFYYDGINKLLGHWKNVLKSRVIM